MILVQALPSGLYKSYDGRFYGEVSLDYVKATYTGYDQICIINCDVPPYDEQVVGRGQLKKSLGIDDDMQIHCPFCNVLNHISRHNCRYCKSEIANPLYDGMLEYQDELWQQQQIRDMLEDIPLKITKTTVAPVLNNKHPQYNVGYNEEGREYPNYLSDAFRSLLR